MSGFKKFFGGFGRLIVAMTTATNYNDKITGISRTIRAWGKTLRVRPDDWYAIERNKYAPWGRGRLGGRDLSEQGGNRVKPASREYA